MNICTGCKNPAKPNRKLCESCTKSHLISNKRQQSELRAAGLCIACRKPAAAYRCGQCALKSSLRKLLGSLDQLDELQKLLEEQHYRCAYTGLPLVVGVNASLDHKVPRASGGSDEIHNLQWIDASINRMKRTTSHEDFVVFLEQLRQSLNQRASISL